jgi:hypothetical protein
LFFSESIKHYSRPRGWPKTGQRRLPAGTCLPARTPMLKKIRVDQVRLGMHLHALEGAWMDHPFWKTRFVIREPSSSRSCRTA